MTDPKDAQRLADLLASIPHRRARGVFAMQDIPLVDAELLCATINEMSAANVTLKNMYDLAMGELTEAERERDGDEDA